MLGPSQKRRSKLLGFLNLPVISKRTHWFTCANIGTMSNQETLELMNTGQGPYKSHEPSCSNMEVVSPPL
uniref:Uncharacterized protein n=1 Tax=Timema tahoe TaxID=61484 RepID=A0A7R9IT59_9NEOP|nr:unnamed protein product [Timema tahoe]